MYSENRFKNIGASGGRARARIKRPPHPHSECTADCPRVLSESRPPPQSEDPRVEEKGKRGRRERERAGNRRLKIEFEGPASDALSFSVVAPAAERPAVSFFDLAALLCKRNRSRVSDQQQQKKETTTVFSFSPTKTTPPTSTTTTKEASRGRKKSRGPW